MVVASPGREVIRFGPFEVDRQTGELCKGERRIRLQEQPLQILLLLLERRGGLVTREELRERLWSDDTIVDFDHSLNTAVGKLRQALDDDPDAPRALETLPRRGYRLIIPVAPGEESPPGQGGGTQLMRVSRRILHLRNFAIALVLLLILSALAYWHWNSRLAQSHPPKRVLLAVLPFANLTGSEQQDYLSDGLTEEIITQLARLDPTRLGVIARSSSTKFKGASIADVGRQLGADYVLEGAVRSGSQRLGITVQLVRVSDQTQLWAEEYDPNVGDTLSLERSVAEHTAHALSLALLPAVQKRYASARPVRPEAREAYLRGRFLLSHGNAPTFQTALEYLQKATDYEPEYADAYAGIADAYILLGNYRLLQQTKAQPKAKAAALRALALDDTLTAARRALASVRWEYELDIPGAGKDFRSAIEGNANDVAAHQWYAAYLSSTGEFDEAIREMKKAAELDPLSLHVGVDLGRALYFARQYDPAIAQFRKVLELDPNLARAHSQLGMALLEKGQYDEALSELRTGIALSGGPSSWLGHAYARAGKKEEAKKQLAAQLELWKKFHTDAYGIALTYMGLGDSDQAFAWLEKDLENHGSVYMIKAYPCWDLLHSDPRYRDLLRRIGLPS